MLNIIVSENASGKSKYLDGLYTTYGASKCIYPGKTNRLSRNVGYKSDALEIVSDLLHADSVIYEPFPVIIKPAFRVSKDFVQYLIDLCADRDYLLIDEPDLLFTDDECGILYSFLSETSGLFKETWLVSHSGVVTGIPVSNIFTINETGGLSPIREEDADEMLI